MRRLVIFSLILISSLSCKKVVLDGLAFPSKTLEEYEFEQYPDGEIVLSDDYNLDPVERYLIPLTSVDQETGETYTIYGVYIGDTSKIKTDTVIYYGHGQSAHMDNYWTRCALLANLGGQYNYGVFMIDYRGYGMSEGKSSETGLTEDVDAGLDWLIQMGLNEDHAIFYGYSLGAIPMIERTAYRTDFKPSKLICESPLASVENLAQSSVLLNVDGDFVTELNFTNAENMKDVKVPYLWFHGVDDDYIELNNGELIYANHSGSYKEAQRIEKANHSDIPLVMGLQNYLNTVLTFIRK